MLFSVSCARNEQSPLAQRSINHCCCGGCVIVPVNVLVTVLAVLYFNMIRYNSEQHSIVKYNILEHNLV